MLKGEGEEQKEKEAAVQADRGNERVGEVCVFLKEKSFQS